MRSVFSFLLNTLLLLTVSPLIAQTASGHAVPQAATHGPKQYPVHISTNLQVLPKDIPPQQLIQIMLGFRSALGVDCNFCHAEDPQTQHLNLASDEKVQKAIARTMIRMTETINANYLSTIDDPQASGAQKAVTCATCHRGSERPVAFVAPSRAD